MSVNDKTVKYAKLEWYKEVLSLEPNSKLFLPLARLLAELGAEDNNADMMNEAFDVLRRGLDIQPEYMEARLFLIELLNTCGCKAQCGAEVARLASLFLSYPDFWDAWREYAITENESSDFTAALGFMSAIMRNKSLSIVQVLEAGLNSLKSNSAPLFSPETINLAKNIEKSGIAKMPGKNFTQIKTCLDTVSVPKEEPAASVPPAEPANAAELAEMAEQETAIKQGSAEQAEPAAEKTENPVVADAPAVLAEPIEPNEPAEPVEDFVAEKAENEIKIMPSELADVLPKSHVDNYKNFAEHQSNLVQDKTKSTKETLAELIKDANITIEPIENSLFRTKSMADLLAEQGDYRGALEIYKELLAKGYGNKEELEERIADVKMLAPELNVEIDKSKLLAIDDLVDTSFGTMAESLSTMQAGNVDLEEEQAQADSTQVEKTAAAMSQFVQTETIENEASAQEEQLVPQEQIETDEPAEKAEPAETTEQPADVLEEEQVLAEEPVSETTLENIPEKMENTAAVPCAAEQEEQGGQAEQAKKTEKKSKSQADVADLLTKLAERLEIRAS